LETAKGNVYSEVLAKWIDDNQHDLAHIHKFKSAASDLSHEDSWDLYALSRCSDLLLLRFQENHQKTRWLGPIIENEQRNAFFTALGMTLIDRKAFHPFFHEIVEVTQDPDESLPPVIESEVWPGFMLGDMMFCRAGVRVRSGIAILNKPIAERSTLYFSYIRNNRPASDMSHGWGHNSQWRTGFRRDYLENGNYCYNVDGQCELEDTSSRFSIYNMKDLSAIQRIELVTNRCFVTTRLSDDEDPHPFNVRYTDRIPRSEA
jgi:hypothetical protein